MQQRLQNRAQDGTLAGAWTSLLHLGRTFTFSKAFEDRLATLTVDDLNAALRKHIDPSKISVVKAGAFK
jgi:zinc protease